MKTESFSSTAEAVLSSSSSTSLTSSASSSLPSSPSLSSSSSSVKVESGTATGVKKKDNRIHIKEDCDEEAEAVLEEEDEDEKAVLEEEGKDDNNENYKPQVATDDDYAGWKVGDWCWLLPKRTTDNENYRPQAAATDNDYASWKVGDWCWLLSTTGSNNNNNGIKNEKSTHHQQRVQNGSNTGCCTHSVKSEEGATTNATSKTTTKIVCGKRTSSRRHYHHHHESNDDCKDDEKPPPTKKTRLLCPPSHNNNNNSSSTSSRSNNNNNNDSSTDEGITIKSDRIQHEEDISYDDENDDEEEEEDDDEDSNSTSTITNNSIDVKVNSSSNDEGYESWTEGNWCLVLPNMNNNSNKETEKQQEVLSSDEKVNTKTTTARRVRTSSRPHQGQYHNQRWNGMFQRLLAYKKQHKSTIVPQKYEADPQLASWVSRQRGFHKNKELSVDRTCLLDSIMFVWAIYEVLPWEEMYSKLVEYKRQHGSTIVPTNSRLGEWVGTQRKVYNKGGLLKKRYELLSSIGFAWTGVKKNTPPQQRFKE